MNRVGSYHKQMMMTIYSLASMCEESDALQFPVKLY